MSKGLESVTKTAVNTAAGRQPGMVLGLRAHIRFTSMGHRECASREWQGSLETSKPMARD